MARICVLSPISARPTTMVEIRKASMVAASGVGQNETWATTPAPDPWYREPMPKVSPSLADAGATTEAEHVDAGPPIYRGRLLPSDRARLAQLARISQRG